MDASPGSYAVILRNATRKTIQVGRRKQLAIEPGYYIYLGSAFGSGGLAARLGHHLRIAQRPRWHIDYLRPHLGMAAIWYAEDPRRMEHEWARALAAWASVSCAWPGFGASDCRCVSHLWHSPRRPSREGFRRQVGRDTPIETFEE